MNRNTIVNSIYLLLLFLPLCTPGFAQVADESSSFRLAQSFEQAGKYEEALRYYQDLTTARPMNPAYFDGVRRCLTQLKRYDEVITALTARIQLFPGELTLYVQRGSAWYLKGDETRAVADWDHAVEARPMAAEIYNMIADEAINIRQYDKAVMYLLRARDAFNTPQLFVFEVARAYAMSMRFDKAMEEYIGYLLDSPQSLWQVQQHIAQFSDIPEALASALSSAKEAAGDRPSDANIRYLLAWLYMEGKRYDEAYEVYRDIDRIRSAGGIELLQFAQRAFNDKAYQAAQRAYRELARAYPDASFIPEAEFHIARCREAGLETVNMAVDPLLPDGGAAGDPVAEARSVIDLYREVARKYPSHPVGIESAYRIGLLTFQVLGDVDGALDLLEKAAPLRRSVLGHADADILIGDALLVKGDLTGSRERYEAVLRLPQITPAELEAVRFKIAELHYFEGDFAKATEELEPLTTNSAADIANDALALSLFIGQFTQPSDAPLKRFAHARLLERQRRYPESAAEMKAVIASFPTSPLIDHAALALGDGYLAVGNTAEAARTWEEALAKYTESVLRDQYLFALGRMYEERLRNREKALEFYQRILTTLPNSILAGKARERILALRKGSS